MSSLFVVNPDYLVEGAAAAVGHCGGLHRLVSTDTGYLSLGRDGRLCEWYSDFASGRLIRSGGLSWINDAAVLPSGQVVSVDECGDLYVDDVLVRSQRGRSRALAVSTRSEVVIASEDGVIQAFDMKTAEPTFLLKTDTPCFVLEPFDSLMVAAGVGSKLSLFDSRCAVASGSVKVPLDHVVDVHDGGGHTLLAAGIGGLVEIDPRASHSIVRTSLPNEDIFSASKHYAVGPRGLFAHPESILVDIPQTPLCVTDGFVGTDAGAVYSIFQEALLRNPIHGAVSEVEVNADAGTLDFKLVGDSETRSIPLFVSIPSLEPPLPVFADARPSWGTILISAHNPTPEYAGYKLSPTLLERFGIETDPDNFGVLDTDVSFTIDRFAAGSTRWRFAASGSMPIEDLYSFVRESLASFVPPLVIELVPYLATLPFHLYANADVRDYRTLYSLKVDSADSSSIVHIKVAINSLFLPETRAALVIQHAYRNFRIRRAR